jgi:hypothetical protein
MKRNAWLLIYIFIAIHEFTTKYVSSWNFSHYTYFYISNNRYDTHRNVIMFFATPAPGIYTYAISELISLLQFMLIEIFPVFEKFV